ncbi:MAG: hypothetical protein A2X86_17560 [Bdellovibrionales bacterium GWA2_49_15]|nr:MAG: hypothetical protein A2X86_17560 [Bdellovibrionales bacterium GWA2_49_15]
MESELQSFIANLATQYHSDRCHLLDMFWDIQRSFQHVSKDALKHLAHQLKTSQIDLEDTLTFYHFFHTRPAGKFQIYLDSSVTAWHQGQEIVQKIFENELGTTLGEVSKEFDIGLFATPCIGMSDQGPACLIDFIPFTHLTPRRALFIARQLKQGIPPQKIWSKISNKIHRKDLLLDQYHEEAGLKHAMIKGPEEIINILKISGLRGRGGAGFPTWKKWDFCRKAQGDSRYVICNADEGEPGTFKDRLLLTTRAFMLFEGMAIAAHAVGAQHGIVYLRAEYQYLLPKLNLELTRFKQNHSLPIHIQLGAGAYVCGEETALLESLEGKRGEPRVRPPFPVERGYKGCPTIINNVETFCTVTHLLEHGPKKFLANGTSQSTGTRLFSVSGDVLKRGIFEWPFGITIGQILQEVKARAPLAVQIGGPSGTLINAKEKDRKICFEDLATGGAITIFSEERDILEIIQRHMEFFVGESCGCCSPCRAGNVMLLEFVQKLRSKKAKEHSLENVKAWAKIITHTSRCGLGQTSPNPILTGLKYFPEIFQNLINPDSADGVWNFDLPRATRAFEAISQKSEREG